MPHYQGHNPGPTRPKIRPKNVPEILPKPKMRPKNVPPKVAPMMGTRDPQGRIGVKGPKGGGEAAKARVEVGSDIFNQYNFHVENFKVSVVGFKISKIFRIQNRENNNFCNPYDPRMGKI